MVRFPRCEQSNETPGDGASSNIPSSPARTVLGWEPRRTIVGVVREIYKLGDAAFVEESEDRVGSINLGCCGKPGRKATHEKSNQ